ncbi:MAG: threonine synthase [Chloroflexi bacterium]|nr:threonine synthase [Chloroflexota bacterium]
MTISGASRQDTVALSPMPASAMPRISKPTPRFATVAGAKASALEKTMRCRYPCCLARRGSLRMSSSLQCIDCAQQYPLNRVIYACERCGGLLDVAHDFAASTGKITRELFDERLGALDFPYNSGVWRFKELVYPDIEDAHIVSRGEGNTNLYELPRLAASVGVDSFMLKHEGENPTGSFKDRGMTSGLSHAKGLGMTRVACASTGNTSASMASYAALAGMQGIIFLQNTAIALGKLAQGIAYGGTCLQINADFDRNMALVRQVAERLGIYVLNSINPFRLEGQKSLLFEALQQMRWQAPDWVIVPGGNLGNSSAFGKALLEMHTVGLIDRLPRLAIVQAEGANPLYRHYASGFRGFQPVKADTIATAIKIGDPVNLQKAIRALEWTGGVVEQVSDQQIMDAKALIDGAGIGCEPASACSLAGARKLVERGIIKRGDTVLGILTGHVLKDPAATIGYHADELPGITAQRRNPMLRAEDDLEQIVALLA